MANAFNSTAYGSAFDGGIDGIASGSGAFYSGGFSDGFYGGGTSGVTLSSADIAAIADAVLALLLASTIPVNVTQMNGATVLGNGTSGNLWRG
jgi:hypothetical protein